MSSAILAQHVSVFLESPIKPILMVLPFIPWAWLVSSKLDKDARHFHLNVGVWNAIHLSAGAAALVVMLAVPIFWIGWPVGILLMVTPILVYWQQRNAAVPESEQFSLSSMQIGEKMAARQQARASRDAAIQFSGPDGAAADVPMKEDPLYPVHMATEDILGLAIDARATQVEITVAQDGTTVTQTVDGIRYKREPLPADMGLRVVDYLKSVAKLDVEDRRRRQTADFRLRGPNGGTDLSLTTAGSSSGVRTRIEFDRAKRLNKPYDGLGLLASQLERLAGTIDEHDRHGIILLGAPTGQGLSTTAYAFLGRHDAYTSNIKTLEREVQFRHDGVDHTQFDPTNPDVDYPTALQSILRRDPDVVLTSFVTDRETAQVITEPGMKGPLIYVPQRATTIAEQIREWVKAVGDVKRACKALRAVTNQRLLRSLCPNCRQAYTPTAEQLKKLGLPAANVKQLYRAGGKVQVKNKIENCPICQGSGYLGQLGVFEVFAIDDAARKLLVSGDLKGALAHARRDKMIYLQEAALSKVASGETTIDEVVRVTAPKKEAGSSKPKDAA